jgi:copper homeostasis protein
MERIPMQSFALEICADSLTSALAAQRGGAQRVELCSALSLGGLTPSAGMITCARNHLEIDLFVMIRPRSGDFLYSDAEIEVMKQDILTAKQLGADGVVFGILTASGTVDMERTRELVNLAHPLPATFHRAFDMTADPFIALENLIELGVKRLLTSGQQNSAIEGIPLLSELVRKAENRITVMAGSGIHAGNIRDLMRSTRVTEIHLSGKTWVESEMFHRNPHISMGGDSSVSEFGHFVSDEFKNQANSGNTLIP